MQGRHLLHRTLLGGDLSHLGLEPPCLGTSLGLEATRVKKQNIVLADIKVGKGMGLDGGALGGRPAAAIVDADEANIVVRKLNATERTDGGKTRWCFFDNVVAAVEAEYVAWGMTACMRKFLDEEGRKNGGLTTGNRMGQVVRAVLLCADIAEATGTKGNHS